MSDALPPPFDQTDLDDESFEDVDLSGAELRDRSFRDCRFIRVRLAEAVLAGSTFEDCEFEDCDLTMARVADAAFRDVAFLRCKLMGIDWTDVRGFAFTVSFEECNLSHATFSNRKMPETVFRECRAHETSFAGVDLTKAVFTGTDLRGARFIDTVLVEADLSEALHYDVSPQQNKLRKTKFSQAAALALARELGVIVPK